MRGNHHLINNNHTDQRFQYNKVHFLFQSKKGNKFLISTKIQNYSHHS